MTLIQEAIDKIEEAEELLLNCRDMPPTIRKQIALLMFSVRDSLKELGIKL